VTGVCPPSPGARERPFNIGANQHIRNSCETPLRDGCPASVGTGPVQQAGHSWMLGEFVGPVGVMLAGRIYPSSGTLGIVRPAGPVVRVRIRSGGFPPGDLVPVHRRGLMERRPVLAVRTVGAHGRVQIRVVSPAAREVPLEPSPVRLWGSVLVVVPVGAQQRGPPGLRHPNARCTAPSEPIWESESGWGRDVTRPGPATKAALPCQVLARLRRELVRIEPMHRELMAHFGARPARTSISVS